MPCSTIMRPTFRLILINLFICYYFCFFRRPVQASSSTLVIARQSWNISNIFRLFFESFLKFQKVFDAQQNFSFLHRPVQARPQNFPVPGLEPGKAEIFWIFPGYFSKVFWRFKKFLKTEVFLPFQTSSSQAPASSSTWATARQRWNILNSLGYFLKVVEVSKKFLMYNIIFVSFTDQFKPGPGIFLYLGYSQAELKYLNFFRLFF